VIVTRWARDDNHEHFSMKMAMCVASMRINASASGGKAWPAFGAVLLTAWMQPTSAPSSFVIGRHITSRVLKLNLMSHV